ncbi:MAG TPA: glycoside hydrolase family 78 protein [Verrucomicrobiae bacterium]|nr:glycoside hydrolase family 78 protein [Verrucomicrobiae bacterium]
MSRKSLIPAFLTAVIVAILQCPQSCAADRLTPDTLRCEYLVDPLGIDETSPRLSWQDTSTVRSERQTSWRILVASSRKNLDLDNGDLWDSGQVDDSETIGAVYRGRSLVSREVCFWKVRVWDKDQKPSAWSKPAMWSMGLLQQADWRGQWIGYDQMRENTVVPAAFDDAKWIWYAGDTFPDIPKGSRYFIANLNLPPAARITKAELLVAAHDKVAFNINGVQAQISEGSDPDDAHLVDVTAQIKPGTNTIRVGVDVAARGPAGLIAKLVVVTDGFVTNTLVTDGSWRATNNGGANWHNRVIGPTEWPAAQIIGPAGCLPWGDLKYTRLVLSPTPYLRKEFAVSKPVERAMLYATALGLIDLHLNGHLVSEDLFTPGWTDYTKRVHYRAYDVTKLVRHGDNALGAILADGWYSGCIGWEEKQDNYGKKPRFLGQLQIDFTDGSKQVIVTGSDWKAWDGPIREADFLMGETYDARLENNWDEPGFEQQDWAPVDVGSELSPLIQAHPGPPMRSFATLEPKSITEPKRGVYVFDMGQNFAGVARLKYGGKSGQVITLRFAERLNPDGTIYTQNLRGARATDTYICGGNGVETWEPRFTYHGFQYVELTGVDRKPAKDTITGVAFSSATTDTGKFTCSDPMLNRLERNIYWTQRANFMDIPTDCPQRDERLGWMGDAQVYIRAATLHEDVQAFFTKWLVDVQDGQRADGQFPMVAPVKVAGDDGGPAWADAGVICPWTIYEVYGDTRILESHYDSMVRFIEFCKNRSTWRLLPPKNFQCFGDWLNIHDETPKPVIYTAYFAYSTKLLARAAEVLGKTSDAAKYNKLFGRIKAAFNSAYVTGDGRIEGDTQTDYVLALSFDLLDGKKTEFAAKRLVENIQKRNWHLSTGFIGTKSLMLTLAMIDRNDVAERLLHNDTFPSWGFSIKQGATSIWERWDGWTPAKGFQDPGMNSFAHYSFGAVYQWMVENLGGIQSADPGYKHIVIEPQFDGRLNWADTTFDSIRGRIQTHWTREGNKVRLKVTIPANTTAKVHLFSEVYEIGSGTSEFLTR